MIIDGARTGQNSYGGSSEPNFWTQRIQTRLPRLLTEALSTGSVGTLCQSITLCLPC